MSFQNLKNNSSNALANLQAKVNESANQNSGGKGKDPRRFKHTYDANTFLGGAVIRFLPWGNGERLPWVEWQEFSFKGRGGNYWNRSLRTLGQDDPVAHLNHLQWERKLGGKKGEDETAVRNRGRKYRYVYNIVVINDPANPDNNGKNFLYECGPAIHKMIMAKMVPEHADVKPIPVFDLWQGANFHIRSKNKNSNLNYDDSSFAEPGPLHADDAVLEKIYNGMYDLNEFESEDNYKSYDELEKQMIKVLGAQYVSSITGKAISTGDAAAAGANPFNGQEGGASGGDPFAQPQQPNDSQAQSSADPFAQPQQPNDSQAQSSADPFANENAASASDSSSTDNVNSDPFANENAASASDSSSTDNVNSDPFANAASGGDDDPFAGMQL